MIGRESCLGYYTGLLVLLLG